MLVFHPFQSLGMLQNYFKVAFRTIWKNKIFSAINIVGLAVGMAVCMVIMLFVFYERSFDRMHARNVYRLNEVQTFEGMLAPMNVALSMYPMGPTLEQEFPEVKNFVRLNGMGSIPVFHDGKRVQLSQSFLTDPSFFRVFDFKLVQGDRDRVLKEPNSVVLTRDAASRIFGTADAIGRDIHIYGSDTLTLKVTGIMGNVPGNSHVQFEALVSFNTVSKPDDMNNWGSNYLNTYLELAEGTDVAALEKQFPAYLKRHMKDGHWKHFQLFLQPLTDIHAGSGDIEHDYVNDHKFDVRYTYLFSMIAAVVLIIAAVNFMNLSTARSAGRAKEVGVRKSIGARRGELARQFIGESVLLALLALALAMVIVWAVLPAAARFSQRALSFSLIENPALLPVLLGGALMIGVLSGIYPAFFLSAFEPVKVLKGVVKSGKSRFRNALVVAQFSSAVFLMIATAFAVRQLDFMVSKDPGFQKDQVVIIPLDSRSDTQFDVLKRELLGSAFIEGVTGSQQRLGNNLHQTAVLFKGTGPKRELTTSQIIVDPDFISLYKIKLIAGEDFTKNPADNARTYLINKSLARQLLENEPTLTMETLIGKQFGFYGMDSLSRIAGVVDDFNFNSMHHKIEPLCIFNQKNWMYSELSVRVKGNNAQQALGAMEAAWKKFLPEEPFKYSFLDQHFAEMYRADTQVSEIVGILAGLAIFISCLGLFGLASYSAERRIKEIGVRKVLGASVAGIVALLSRDFLQLVLLAILIASPLAWWAVRTWLNDFAYRIDVEWWMFAMAGALAVLIALCTISYQSIRAALMNPVKSLKTD